MGEKCMCENIIIIICTFIVFFTVYRKLLLLIDHMHKKLFLENFTNKFEHP